MAGYAMAPADPQEIDETRSMELRHLSTNAILRARPSGTKRSELERCDPGVRIGLTRSAGPDPPGTSKRFAPPAFPAGSGGQRARAERWLYMEEPIVRDRGRGSKPAGSTRPDVPCRLNQFDRSG